MAGGVAPLFRGKSLHGLPWLIRHGGPRSSPLGGGGGGEQERHAPAAVVPVPLPAGLGRREG